MIFLFSMKKHFKIIEQRNYIFKMNMKKPSRSYLQLHICMSVLFTTDLILGWQVFLFCYC